MNKLVDHPRFTLIASTIKDGDFAVPRASATPREMRIYEDRIMTLCAFAGIRPRAVRVARLVHGNVVASVWNPRSTFEYVDDVDGLVTSRRGVALVVTGADCPPIFAVSQFVSCIGLAHSGRAGTLRNIALELVQVMRDHIPHAPLDAWIGPGICGSCYEVGESVLHQFTAYRDARSKTGACTLDLPAVIESQLRSAVVLGGVERVGGCTKEQPDVWHSYRRDTQQGVAPERPRVQAFIAMMHDKA